MIKDGLSRGGEGISSFLMIGQSNMAGRGDFGEVAPIDNPDCYMLCKENATGKGVWIGNFFADECLFKTVTLDRAYEKIEFINCTGRLRGDRVEIDEIAPYASVGFIVE